MSNDLDYFRGKANYAKTGGSLVMYSELRWIVGRVDELEAALRQIVAKEHDMRNPYHEALQIARAALAGDGGGA